MSKTNAVRILEDLGIPFELRSYDVDEDDLSAQRVAEKVGMPLEQVYKTLVAKGDRGGVVLAVIAADRELDLKALARATGDRSVALVPLKDVQPLTGYIRGGVTALGMKKTYRVIADDLIELHDRISVSAGQRGLQIIITPADYLRATSAKLAPISS
jgi:Cys-tRNA(Pro)/Cys-tRNA(Cys) deacylase